MKNIKINHTFTLREILIDIKYASFQIGTENSLNSMKKKVEEYLEMIE